MAEEATMDGQPQNLASIPAGDSTVWADAYPLLQAACTGLSRSSNNGENPQDLLAAAGLEDSDIEDEAAAAPSASAGRQRRAWSESDDDEPIQRRPESSPVRENSAELQQRQESDGGIREDNRKLNGGDALDEEEA